MSSTSVAAGVSFLSILFHQGLWATQLQPPQGGLPHGLHTQDLTCFLGASTQTLAAHREGWQQLGDRACFEVDA